MTTKTLKSQLVLVKKASTQLALLTDAQKKQVLSDLAKDLVKPSTMAKILAANQQDLHKMPAQDPRYDRLLLNKDRLKAIASDVKKVATLPSKLGQTLEARTLKNGLKLKKIAVPLGVIGIIYEARPNVTIDVFALCFKTSNACVLKVGSDAYHSSLALYQIIQKVLRARAINPSAVYLLPPDREAVKTILQARAYIDVIIPRGSQGLIDYVRENSKIPVIETGAGIVHTFFDESGKLEYARSIIFNAKTRRPGVCNALDTLIIHQKRLKDLPAILEKLGQFPGGGVEIFADAKSYTVLIKQYKGADHNNSNSKFSKSNSPPYPAHLLHHATAKDFGREFLSLKMAIKTVATLDEALQHIATHGSKHSEAIISQNPRNISKFLNEVDAACIYANTSTAFTDGAQFGMGAEIGISTQKLHARGPMALNELLTHKWLIEGQGQVRP